METSKLHGDVETESKSATAFWAKFEHKNDLWQRFRIVFILLCNCCHMISTPKPGCVHRTNRQILNYPQQKTICATILRSVVQHVPICGHLKCASDVRVSTTFATEMSTAPLCFADRMRRELRAAVRAGDRQRVRKLMAQGANANEALLEHVEHGNQTCVGLLIRAGADVNHGHVLHAAVERGYMQTVGQLLAAGADVNAENVFGATPLLEALDYTCHCADCVKRFDYQWGMYSCPRSDPIVRKLVKKLLEAGADVNLANDMSLGNTPLMIAVSKAGCATSGDIMDSVVDDLIKAGADVNKSNNLEHTPLHFAAEHGPTSVVRKLIEAGAVVNVRNWVGETPLVSTLCSYVHVHHPFKHTNLCIEDTVAELLAKGADVNLSDMNGNTPLACVISYHGNQGDNLVTKMIQAGADANDHLELAIGYGVHVPALLAAGARADTRYFNFELLFVRALQTPERYVTPETRVRNLKALLRHGVHVRHRDFAFWRQKYFCGDPPQELQALALAAGAWRDIFWNCLKPCRLPVEDDVIESLQSLCRTAIRRHLVEVSPVNLFVRVSKLGLPRVMEQFLLYDMSLDE